MKKEIKIPAKGLFAFYDGYSLNFATSKEAANNNNFEDIALPSWAVKAINEYITRQNQEEINNFRKKLKELLGIKS